MNVFFFSSLRKNHTANKIGIKIKCKNLTVTNALFYSFFLQNCVFKKMYDETSIRVFYSGALRIMGCFQCCKRWYFTFNGAECSGPMPIDGIIYIHRVRGAEPLRVRHIEGYCENIHKGIVRVGFRVGNCPGMGTADAHSGEKSVSRIAIEEVPAPQK